MTLPPILFHKNFRSVEKLAQEAYRIFEFDFISNIVNFEGYRIKLKSYPQNNSYGFNPTFWHIITKNNHNDSLDEIDIERVTRVAWIAPIIIGSNDTNLWKYWELRNGKPRICLVYPKNRYVIILEPRYRDGKIEYILLWSAFFIIPEKNLVKYKSAYNNFVRKYGKFDVNNCPLKNRGALL